MRLTLLFVIIAATAAVLAQQDVDLMSNAQLAQRVETLSKQGKDTYAEQVRLTWILAMRSGQSDGNAHKVGKPIAERLRDEDPLNPRAKFAYGFFRVREAFDTVDPVTRKRRLDEGRRPMSESLIMGARDPDFLTDAGILLVNLRTEVNLYKQGINALALAKRMWGEAFTTLAPERQADWHAAMAAGLLILDLDEIARDHYAAAVAASADSPSGRKAIAWLRAHGGALR